MTKTTLSAILLALATTLALGCADVESLGQSEDGVSGRPYFEVFAGQNGAFYFHFSAANHEIILASQGYKTRTAALGGVLSVLDNAVDATAFRLNPAKNGGSYFNVVAANGEIIATSEVYSTASSARRGIEGVIDNVGDYLDFTARRTGARFVVFATESGKYMFQLRAKNGEIVLASQSYVTEAAALNGAFSVAENGTTAANFQILAAANGGHYFNLKAANGEIIATSEVYSTKSNATRGRNAITALIPTVDIL